MEKSSQKTASTGQVLELVSIINRALARAIKETDPCSEQVQKIIGKPGVIYKYFETLLSEGTKILKPIFTDRTFTIEDSSGEMLISEAKETFKSGISPDFTKLGLNKPTGAKPKRELAPHKMIHDATFAQMFSELSPDLDKIVMDQEQIIKFCKKHRALFCQEVCITFFLTKVDCRFFVICVTELSDGLDASVYPFDHNHVWNSENCHRVFAPKLEP